LERELGAVASERLNLESRLRNLERHLETARSGDCSEAGDRSAGEVAGTTGLAKPLGPGTEAGGSSLSAADSIDSLRQELEQLKSALARTERLWKSRYRRLRLRVDGGQARRQDPSDSYRAKHALKPPLAGARDNDMNPADSREPRQRPALELSETAGNGTVVSAARVANASTVGGKPRFEPGLDMGVLGRLLDFKAKREAGLRRRQFLWCAAAIGLIGTATAGLVQWKAVRAALSGLSAQSAPSSASQRQKE
jgi:hypothetical protein